MIRLVEPCSVAKERLMMGNTTVNCDRHDLAKDKAMSRRRTIAVDAGRGSFDPLACRFTTKGQS